MSKRGNAKRNRWVWVKMKPPGDRRFWSMCTLTRVPFGVPIFDPQPGDDVQSWLDSLEEMGLRMTDGSCFLCTARASCCSHWVCLSGHRFRGCASGETQIVYQRANFSADRPLASFEAEEACKEPGAQMETEVTSTCAQQLQYAN